MYNFYILYITYTSACASVACRLAYLVADICKCAPFLQYSAANLPAGSKATYLLNIGDMAYAGAAWPKN